MNHPTVAVPPSACPRCGGKFEALTHVVGPHEKSKPGPGDFSICDGCGVILRFGESLELVPLDELPTDIDEDARSALLCAQAFIHGNRDARRYLEPAPCPACGYALDPKRAQEFDGRAPTPGDFAQCPQCKTLLVYGDGPGHLNEIDAPPVFVDATADDKAAARQHGRALALTAAVVQRYMRDFPDRPPRFALAPEEFGIIAPVSVMAPAICKNAAAVFIVKGLVYLSNKFGVGEPTYMMLEAALKAEGVPFETVSLADLGLVEHDRRPS